MTSMGEKLESLPVLNRLYVRFVCDGCGRIEPLGSVADLPVNLAAAFDDGEQLLCEQCRDKPLRDKGQ